MEESITIVHLRDDLVKQRARVLRRITDDVEMLSEALVALRRDPPKVHVVDDHLERVISSLKNEIELLRKK